MGKNNIKYGFRKLLAFSYYTLNDKHLRAQDFQQNMPYKQDSSLYTFVYNTKIASLKPRLNHSSGLTKTDVTPAILSRDKVAHSCDKVARQNRRCDIGLKHDGPTGQTTGLADWPI